ncbi:MAG: hypothetical protein CMF62_03505 [Magnetococcales bacterium]|nr:hypothetical protein [Magnetococcales bacterium]|tara:strand:- start:52135 stop:53136 length:1002 start_codon:yes stop_codon:yes gene_type:complete
MTLWNDKIKSSDVLVISTCMDPEDYIAIYLMKHKIREMIELEKPVYFLVGENNALKKHFMLLKFLYEIGLFKLQNNKFIDIIKGEGSNDSFQNEGSDILSNSIKKMVDYSNPSIPQTEYKKLNNVFYNYSNVSIISMKPMREFLKIYKENNNIFYKTTLFGYMGYNINVLGDVKDKFLNSFKSVYYYESTNVTPNNLFINDKNSFNYLNFKYFNRYILNAIHNWNTDMTRYYISKLKNEIEIENGSIYEVTNEDIDELDISNSQKERIKKYLFYIKKCKNKNSFRNSDCGLIYMLLEAINHNYLTNDKIKVFTSDEPKKVYLEQIQFYRSLNI